MNEANETRFEKVTDGAFNDVIKEEAGKDDIDDSNSNIAQRLNARERNRRLIKCSIIVVTIVVIAVVIGFGVGLGLTSEGDRRYFSVADIQAGLNKCNQLQGGITQATQDIANKFNAIPTRHSLYRQVALLTHMIWESGGFQFNQEIAATTPPYSTIDSYQTCQNGQSAPNGKKFFGRGYIQLSWCYNYQAYGQARMVNNDPDYFYNNPETVATTYAVDSAAWFFETNVLDTSGNFGSTTKSVNGLECESWNNYVGSVPQKRWQIFQAIASQVGLTGYLENGCYN